MQRTTQNKQYIEQHKKYIEQHTTQKLGRVRAVPRLCGFYPGFCLTTEEKHGKTSVRLAIDFTVETPSERKEEG
jgi:hypothetical protein